MAPDARTAIARVQHRLGFGPAGNDYLDGLSAGPDSVLATMLAQAGTEAAAADDRRTPAPDVPYIAVSAFASRSAAEAERRSQERKIKLWWLDRMVTTRQPLVERLTWFWHGHWATSQIKVRDARFMLQQNQTLRTHALGDFGAMARAMLKDPALLIWLDGRGSIKGRPNENLAREFLELFTLGEGHYSEQDVREVARALTGWQLDVVNGMASLASKRFDDGSKSILGSTGPFDADAVADLVVRRSDCANWIAARLWRHAISATPPTPIQLTSIASAFASARNIGAATYAAAGQLVTVDSLPWAKSPVDWAVSTLRALGMRPTELNDAVQQGLLSDLSTMGQIPFFPPNVSGWPAGQRWFTATSTQARLKCTRRLVTEAPKWLKKATVKTRPQVLADRLGVPAWSIPTQQALLDPTNSPTDALIVALNAPDYLVGV